MIDDLLWQQQRVLVHFIFALNNWQRVIFFFAGKIVSDSPFSPWRYVDSIFMWLTQILKSWEAHDAHFLFVFVFER
jgi:hypothetical protein